MTQVIQETQSAVEIPSMPSSVPSSISVQFLNELPDHLEAQRILYRKSFLGKADKAVAVLLLGFGAYCVVVVGPRWWTLIWFPLAVVEWFDLLGLGRLRMRIAFSRNPKYREAYHLSFTLQDLHFKTVSIDSTVQWTHYNRVIEGPNIFLLMYGKGLYTLVPKRCFATEEATNDFRVLLSQTIPQAIPQ